MRAKPLFGSQSFTIPHKSLQQEVPQQEVPQQEVCD
jgi:hypothetical protein